MRKLAIVLTIFPGSLFVLAAGSYTACRLAEAGLPSGGPDIGLGLLLVAALINIPTVLAWIASWMVDRLRSSQR